MFKKHDKILFIAQLVFWIMTALIAGTSIVCAFILAAAKSLLSILVIVGGLFGSFVFWVLSTLLISYLKDIKLIRNKLYGIGMEGLEIPPQLEKPHGEEQSDEFNNED